MCMQIWVNVWFTERFWPGPNGGRSSSRNQRGHIIAAALTKISRANMSSGATFLWMLYLTVGLVRLRRDASSTPLWWSGWPRQRSHELWKVPESQYIRMISNQLFKDISGGKATVIIYVLFWLWVVSPRFSHLLRWRKSLHGFQIRQIQIFQISDPAHDGLIVWMHFLKM